ncbi:MAG: cell division protein ZipA C-terminal FtsZ-binding domain-containing protein [Pseudomonadota bacterium]
MDDLRIALLILGVVVIVLVYLTTRRRDSAPVRNSAPEARVEPSFSASDAPMSVGEAESPLPTMQAMPTQESLPEFDSVSEVSEAPLSEAHEEPALESDADHTVAPPADMPDKVISLRVVNKTGGDFSAADVVLALRNTGMRHGRFGIFHYHVEETDGEPLFSAANLTEPGTFDLQGLQDKRMGGLSMFMLRPGPGRGVDAFDLMMKTARSVSVLIDGELLDGEGNSLSIQRERYLREEIIQYELDHLKFS